MAKIYLIGSLRNENIPAIAQFLRDTTKLEVFDDWYSAGPEADDYWKDYEVHRGRSYSEALEGYAARHVFDFDLSHLESSDYAVLSLPAGRSGHLELGFMVGRGRRAYIHLDQSYVEEGRYDVMYRFAIQSGGLVTESLDEISRHIVGV